MNRTTLFLALAAAPFLAAKPSRLPGASAQVASGASAQAAPGADGAPALPGSPAGSPAAPGGFSGPSAPRPAPISAPWMDARAQENKDPELAEERKALDTLRQEKSALEAELALAESKRRTELAPLFEERSRIEFERGLRQARFAAKSAELDVEKTKLERKLAALTADYTLKSAEKLNRIRDLENESRAIRTADDLATLKPRTDTALRKARDEAARIAVAPDAYPEDPVIDGVLHISDRRVPFNGVVTDQLADFVTARIAFFNKKDEKAPIFIVIDNSPGGSVFAELRILRAMESSKAPVYVVVKQAAASCAAITTTLAKKSFCYPHTRILHHQMSTGMGGNMTKLRESLRFSEDLYNRTFAPVLKKLGYADAAAFEKDMYANVSTGDWVVFGDEAVRRMWADVLVERMVETGADEFQPDSQTYGTPAFAAGCEMKRDESGRVYFQLPTLTTPGDTWLLDDPSGIFRR